MSAYKLRSFPATADNLPKSTHFETASMIKQITEHPSILHFLVDSTDNQLGYFVVDGDDNSVKSEEMQYLKFFEVFPENRKQGLGKVMLKEMLKIYPSIYFNAIPGSACFWMKSGAIPYDNCVEGVLCAFSKHQSPSLIFAEIFGGNCGPSPYGDKFIFDEISRKMWEGYDDSNQPS